MTRADGRMHHVHVAWPVGPAPAAGFPVLYLLDANATFGTVVEAIRMRSHRPESTGVVPAIVVGLAYPTDAPYARAHRHEDYTPWPPAEPLGERESHGAVPKADVFLDFLLGDVRRAIEADYAIDARRQTLVGHSLGGLLALYTLVTRPQAFSHYVAVGPSIWWNPPALFDALDQSPLHGIARADRPRALLAVGEFEQRIAPWQQSIDTDEVRARRAARQVVDNAVRFGGALRTAGLDVHNLEFDSEDHASVVTRALGPALRFALGA